MHVRDRWENAVTLNGLVICMIAKNATVSLRDALLRAQGIFRNEIVDFSDLDCSFPNQTTGFRVAFIRDPVDRTLSCWRNKILRQGICEKEPRLLRHGYQSGCTLDEFIQVLKEVHALDKHTDHQHKYLARTMDYVCAFDFINEHWENLQGKFRWLPDLRRLNQTEPMTDIPMVLKKQIRQIYAQDYDLYRSLGSSASAWHQERVG